eukprot:1158726-Pelagomonas_calceolata.AAC.2
MLWAGLPQWRRSGTRSSSWNPPAVHGQPGYSVISIHGHEKHATTGMLWAGLLQWQQSGTRSSSWSPPAVHEQPEYKRMMSMCIMCNT